jgi:hypothetical protein
VLALSGQPELAAEIHKIAEHGALYDLQTMARMRRREYRQNRKSMRSSSDGSE